jgi:hypothetical protein
MMKKYLKYLWYLLVHKKNVFKVCFKEKMFIHAFTHDLSKFSRVEFVSYAKKFYGTKEDVKQSGFPYGWLHHQRKNKHHWDYWVMGNGTPVVMPMKYIKQMICDWEAMAMANKSYHTAFSVCDFYKDNKDKMVMHPVTINILETLLKSKGMF